MAHKPTLAQWQNLVKHGILAGRSTYVGSFVAPTAARSQRYGEAKRGTRLPLTALCDSVGTV